MNTSGTTPLSISNVNNLNLAYQNLNKGLSTTMPTLDVVSSTMQQLFGPGPYSTYPTTLTSLIGGWQIINQYPTSSNTYVSISSYNSPNSLTASATDLVVTLLNSGNSSILGYLSLQPQNYLIFTPFPSSTISTPSYVPIAGIGLASSNSTISFIMFYNGTLSYWSRINNAGMNNIGISNAINLTNGTLPVTYAPGSPAQYANSLNLTPNSIYNSQQINTAAASNGASYLPASSFFTFNPFGIQSNNLPVSGNVSLNSTVLPSSQAQLNALNNFNTSTNGSLISPNVTSSTNLLNPNSPFATSARIARVNPSLASPLHSSCSCPVCCNVYK